MWQQMLAHHEGYPVAVVRAGGTLAVVGRNRLDTGRHHVGDVRANFNVAVLTDQPAYAIATPVQRDCRPLGERDRVRVRDGVSLPVQVGPVGTVRRSDHAGDLQALGTLPGPHEPALGALAGGADVEPRSVPSGVMPSGRSL
jgi:hypothetical protein